MTDELVNVVGAAERRKAGHQEILGETLAKFEFFQHGWHPYSRFLDIDKIDLILRRRVGGIIHYREVQVKFGKLYICEQRWEQPLFSLSSWRFFSDEQIEALAERENIYVAYVLSPDDGFKGDMFVFPVAAFADTIRHADKLSNGKYRVYISRSKDDPTRWYLRRQPRFTQLTPETVLEVTQFYRNFRCLEPA